MNIVLIHASSILHSNLKMAIKLFLYPATATNTMFNDCITNIMIFQRSFSTQALYLPLQVQWRGVHPVHLGVCPPHRAQGRILGLTQKESPY